MTQEEKEIVEKFISENHWLVCDCDLDGGQCSMYALIQPIIQVYRQGREDVKRKIGQELKKWFNGRDYEDIEDAIERITGIKM